MDSAEINKAKLQKLILKYIKCAKHLNLLPLSQHPPLSLYTLEKKVLYTLLSYYNKYHTAIPSSTLYNILGEHHAYYSIYRTISIIARKGLISLQLKKPSLKQKDNKMFHRCRWFLSLNLLPELFYLLYTQGVKKNYDRKRIE